MMNDVICGQYWLSSSYFILYCVFRFFPFETSGVSRGKLLQSYIVINVTGLIQFVKNLSYILPPLGSQNYLLQSISVKLIYQFLYLVNDYLFFRCLEKVFEEERNENRKRISQGVTTSQLPQKENRKVKNRNDKILGFDLVFVGQNSTDFNVIFCYYCLFSKSFQGFNLVI